MHKEGLELRGFQPESVKENRKASGFCGRSVKCDSINIGGAICSASVGIAAYVLASPVLGAIGLGAVGILLYRRSVTKDPFAENLLKIKSQDLKERLDALKVLCEDFDKISSESQKDVLEAIMPMINVDNETSMEVLKELKVLIDVDQLNDADKFKVFVDGFIAFLEKIDSDEVERSKSKVLIEAIYRFKEFLVKKKDATENNKSMINRLRLCIALDKLNVNENLKTWIDEIKKKLPLSPSEQFELDLKNMESRNFQVRSAALTEVWNNYKQFTSPDDKVAIIKATMKILNYDFSVEEKGSNTLTLIYKMISEGELISSKKRLEAFIDGCIEFIKSCAEMKWTTISEEGRRRDTMFGFITILDQDFFGDASYEEVIEKKEIDTSNLRETLLNCKSSIKNIENASQTLSIIKSILQKMN